MSTAIELSEVGPDDTIAGGEGVGSEILPSISHHMWRRVAVHEAGHAVAYIHAAQAVYGNPNGCRSVHIRPGMLPHWTDDRGREQRGVGECHSSGIFEAGFYKRHRDRGGRLPADLCASLRIQADWEIVCCLAGPLAELDRHGDCWTVPDREDIAEEAGGCVRPRYR